MKNKKIIVLLLLMLTFLFPLSFVKADEEDIDLNKNAYIYSRTVRDHVPVQHVKDSVMATYLLDGEEAIDFRRHFQVIDQGTDVLNMKKQVDGAITIIDNGGYTWDLGGFDIAVVGTYTITINYMGKNGVAVSNSVDITVIAEDVDAPYIDGGIIGTSVTLNIGSTFMQTVSVIRIKDNIDGIITLTEANFEGHEGIEKAALNSVHDVWLTVEDSAGNELRVKLTVTVRDTTPPTILNVKNIETKKGVAVDYKSHLVFRDNYSKVENITIEYTIVKDESGTDATGETEVDFNKVGEVFIKVTATDEGGRSASRVYRVIIKDSKSLGEMLLYINLGLFGVAGLAIGGVVLTRKLRKPKAE